MSIRPIETIIMPSKSQEASVQHNADSQRLASANAQHGIQFNHEIKHNSEQPVKVIKSENNEYRFDAKEKGNGGYSNQNKGKSKGKSKEKANQNEIKTKGFDIKI